MFMRIVIDLQTCQSASRFRGIGRYSLSLATHMIPLLEAQGHEVIIFLHGGFPDELEVVRPVLEQVGKRVRFAVFSVTTPCAAGTPANEWRQRAAELLREHALACLEPDFVHMSQLMADGWGDDTIASIGELGVHIPTALTQYDLIPLVLQDIYLPEGTFREYYFRKLQGVKRSDLLLAISDYSRGEVIEKLGFSAGNVVSISSAVSQKIKALYQSRSVDLSLATLNKFSINPTFLLYAPGGFDARKNMERLLEAFAALPSNIRKAFPLVIASKLYPGQREGLLWMAAKNGLEEADVVLTDYVSDEELVDLYRLCHLYVFPSIHEGFGLPVLEAMVCGAPVVAANCTGVTEAMGLQEALFDPYSVESISKVILRGITDDTFRQQLQAHARIHVGRFSWEQSAEKAVDAIENSHKGLVAKGWVKVCQGDLPTCDELLERLTSSNGAAQPSVDDLSQFRSCFEANRELEVC